MSRLPLGNDVLREVVKLYASNVSSLVVAPQIIQAGDLGMLILTPDWSSRLPALLVDVDSYETSATDLYGDGWETTLEVKLWYLDDPHSVTAASGTETYTDGTVASRIEFLRRLDAVVSVMLDNPLISSLGALPNRAADKTVEKTSPVSVTLSPEELGALRDGGGIPTLQVGGITWTVTTNTRG